MGPGWDAANSKALSLRLAHPGLSPDKRGCIERAGPALTRKTLAISD